MIQIFAPDDEVERLQALLAQQSGAEYCRGLLALAWYLRQQDFSRASQFMAQLEALIPTLPQPREQQCMRLRCELIQAEAVCLNGVPEQAQTMGQQILDAATAIEEWLLVCDAHWLLGSIAADVGQTPKCTHHRQLGQQMALLAGDSQRAQIAELSLAFFEVVGDPACRRWDYWKHIDMPQLSPVCATWVNNLLGLIAAQHGYSVSNWISCFNLAMQTGQRRLAILSANNIGDVLNELNDYESALEWNLRGLEMARPTGWIAATGMSLLQTGQTMRHLGRLDTAADLFTEALKMLAPLPNSRTYAIGVMYMGELALIQGKPEVALDYFESNQAYTEHFTQVDLQLLVWRGHATALVRTGQQRRALELAHRAWDWVRGMTDPKRALEVLKVLAEIYAQTELNTPGQNDSYHYEGLGQRNTQGLPPALVYLQMALELGQQIPGYTIDGGLYDALAQQYALLGQFQQAYEMAHQAGIAREKTHTAQATQSAIAAQVRYQTERAQMEGERERQLALEKAQHLAALQQTRNTLEHLETIGQEMTAQLDLTTLYRILNVHLHQLLDIHVFAVYLLDAAKQSLVREFGVENGELLPIRHLALDDLHADSVACLRQRQVLVRDRIPNTHYPNYVPGTLETLSALYVPLAVGSRALGVMSVQSLQRHAFGEREQLIFHTLCSYAAISFDNANAYQQLLQAQTELAEQEKLTALGGLVAGVAHEMNTPIGNCLMVTSSIEQEARRMVDATGSEALTRSELQQFLEDTQLGLAVLARSLDVATSLISSFQQVAVDRSHERHQVFDLAHLCLQLGQSLGARLQQAGIKLVFELPENDQLDSYPEALAQVLTHLIENAHHHAFADGLTHQPQVGVRASLAAPGRVRLEVKDNGVGIALGQQSQVFEPFFTSQTRQGRCGLGLSVCFNIVTSVLGGQIGVESQLGQGACFYLDLPLVVADVSAATATP